MKSGQMQTKGSGKSAQAATRMLKQSRPFTEQVGALASSTSANSPIQMKKKRNRRPSKDKKEAEKRQKGFERADRGNPDDFVHLDPQVRKSLERLDQQSPKGTAMHRARERFQKQRAADDKPNPTYARRRNRRRNLNQRDLAETRPDILEVGAGTGSGSKFLKKQSLAANRGKFSIRPRYLATDVSAPGGEGGFLRDAQQEGLSTRGKIDANNLTKHFPRESIREIVAANAYGAKNRKPGASYGLVRDLPQNQSGFDDRTLKSAHKVLRPGGTYRFFARTDLLHRRSQELDIPHKKLAPSIQKQSGIKVNRYLDPTTGMMEQAAALGFDVNVKPAEQPDDVVFRRPDTDAGSNKRLGEFNTEIEFRKLHGRRTKGRVNYEIPQAEESDSDSDEELAAYAPNFGSFDISHGSSRSSRSFSSSESDEDSDNDESDQSDDSDEDDLENDEVFARRMMNLRSGSWK